MILHSQIRPRLSLGGIPGLPSDRVAAGLGRVLDDAYHYVPAAAPTGIESIDAVVVGPGGTWALTLDHERGRFLKRNGHWYRWSRSTESWIPWDAAPVLRARLAGHRLELVLESAGLPATVEACLVTGRGIEVDWERDQRPGIHVHDALDTLARRIARDDVLTDAQVDRIVVLLDPRQPLPRLALDSPGT